MAYRNVSESAAISTLKKLFLTVGKTSISIDEASKAWGRHGTTREQDSEWLRDRISIWKNHGLASPIYTDKDGRKVLNGVQISPKGSSALNDHHGDNSSLTSEIENVTFEELKKIADLLRKKYPDIEIVIKL